MNDKILAAARKAARRMARATGTSYQTCLDLVAQQAGRAHWTAFLADPVDVRPTPTPPSTNPDPVDEQTSDDVRLDVVAMVEPATTETIPLTTRLLRLLGSPERAIVRRSEKARLIDRLKARRDVPNGMPLGRSVENGYDLALAETVPVLALSPPGSGKTASVTVPTIVSCDRHSMVVHDDLGLLEMTSGHRSTIGPVTVLDLSGGRSFGGVNPLSSSWLPLNAPAQVSYVTTLARALSPTNVAIADVIARAIQDLARTHGGTTFAQLDESLRAAGDVASLHAATLVSPFLDPGARGCTETTSLRPRDLRGVLDEHGIRPSTLYVVRGAAGTERHALVAAVLQEAIWWWTLTVGPGTTSPDGDLHGVHPVTVLLEDVHRMAHMPSFAGAIERGRARKVAHVVTAPSYRAMSRMAGSCVDELEALFAVQVVLPQNDADTLSRLERRLHGVTRDEMRSINGRSIVALQYESDPIRVHTPFFFKSAEMMRRVYNPRTGTGPRPVTM